MALTNIFDMSGSAMTAQTGRLNAIASNMANAETISGTEEGAYRAQRAVFKAALNEAGAGFANDSKKGAAVTSEMVESQAPIIRRYEPGHPLADETGHIYTSNVNVMEEMAEMIASSRSFQMNSDAMNTAKQLVQKVLTLGQ
ncbi:MAG: flagellar basal body rod protein FlgC [Pseudomonadales bacterium]|nr:flagellar basal body rod protein FlgC [Pseudomonadales bacterium]